MLEGPISADQSGNNALAYTLNPIHFKIIEGSTDILLIAPHACIRGGKPRDDENTGPITEILAQEIGCSAIINTHYHKPDGKKYSKDHKPGKDEYPYGLNYNNLDLNVIDDAELVPDYLKAIRDIVDEPGKTTVIWIHGADDTNANNVAKSAQYPYQPDDIHAFIGFGQGKNPDTGKGKNRYTEEPATVKLFKDALIRF
jgi:hypothetical protein